MTFFHKIKSNNITSKTFSYNKGNCNLNFTLRTDIKNELKDFKEILELALLEVKDEINK